jgi:4a-hydroxytetrahydrobiopterin dehydratase
MAELLSDDEIRDELPDEWRLEGDRIERTFEFDDYLDGVAFASEVGELAEEEFHHPEITIGYKQVTVSFTSHEEGGVTNKDIRMARATNERR